MSALLDALAVWAAFAAGVWTKPALARLWRAYVALVRPPVTPAERDESSIW